MKVRDGLEIAQQVDNFRFFTRRNMDSYKHPLEFAKDEVQRFLAAARNWYPYHPGLRHAMINRIKRVARKEGWL